MMKTMIGTATVLLALSACQIPVGNVGGQDEARVNPLATLGVTEAQMQACMTERPAQGERPDAQALVSCLNSNGANVTVAQVDAAMKAGAPAERPQ